MMVSVMKGVTGKPAASSQRRCEKLTKGDHEAFSKPVAIDRTSNASFNGGLGGTTAKATPDQLAAEWEHHIAATPEQTRHAEAAAKDPHFLCREIMATPRSRPRHTPGYSKLLELWPPVWASQQKRRPRTPPPSATQSSFRAKWRTTLHRKAVRTSTGSNENKSLPGAKSLERQIVKLVAPAPHRSPSPLPPTTPPQTAKPVARHCVLLHGRLSHHLRQSPNVLLVSRFADESFSALSVDHEEAHQETGSRLGEQQASSLPRAPHIRIHRLRISRP